MSTFPLSESTKYFVLLALAESTKYGYEIRAQIVGDTLGVYVRDSMLYAVLAALERDGLIEEAAARDKGVRKTYQLTDLGRRKLELQAKLLYRGVRLAQERLRFRLP